jgi:hypothetical protein
MIFSCLYLPRTLIETLLFILGLDSTLELVDVVSGAGLLLDLLHRKA